ncbi:MAG: hypothetical protein CVU26_01535 [Betaproteobacteria bacterium HGW-Betaproteobacteria-2]|jgi:hypothetical protein|nr:MAG: hypothetical protein CVU26_01535 [Betaproteobacteria bacterium HGW-Betaproteobacteria-2]
MKLKLVILLAITVQLLSINSISAAPLEGRLFTTPLERARLDQLRLTSKPPSKQELLEEETADVVVPVAPRSVSVQGYITRSDGKKGTVWINDTPVQENDEAGDVRVRKLPQNGNQVQISIPSIGRDLNLKAGQVYVPETDSISEDKARMTDRPQEEVEDVGTIGASPNARQ